MKIAVYFSSMLMLLSLQAEPFVTRERISVGPFSITGDPALFIPLCKGTVGNINLDLGLRHRLNWDDTGECSSLWEIPILMTSLYPSGHGLITWSVPGGDIIVFRFENSHYISSVKGWILQKLTDDRYEVLGETNWAFIYDKGQLVEFRKGAGATYVCKAAAGLIHEIQYKRGGLCIPILSAKYTLKRQTLELTYGDYGYSFKYDLSGTLNTISCIGKGKEARFAYQNGLVCTIYLGKGRNTSVKWSRAPRFDVGDNMFFAPVFASQIGESHCNYSIDGEVVRLKVSDPQFRGLLQWNIRTKALRIDDK